MSSASVRPERLGRVRHINLGNPPSFFYTPTWSPDSKKIAYSDKRLNLWYVDLDNPKPKLIDTDYYGGFGPTQLNQTWAPDSKWVAYSRQLSSGQHAVFVYSLDQGKVFPDHRRHERRALSRFR